MTALLLLFKIRESSFQHRAVIGFVKQGESHEHTRKRNTGRNPPLRRAAKFHYG
jgi:hypothetical protein